MEQEICDNLVAVGYDGPLLDINVLDRAVKDSSKLNVEFRNLVAWIADEIAGLGGLDERISKDDDANTFALELSAFLKEIQCPYQTLTTGLIASRLESSEARYLLLDYLIGELMAQKMANVTRLREAKKDLAITLHETPTAAALKDIAITLNLGKPPENITAKAIFDKINIRIDEVLKRSGGMRRIGKPLFNPPSRLSDEQWAKLSALQQELDEEYDLRRKMLITRLDVTIQSFQWSDRIKGKEGEISERYAAKRQKLDSLQTGGKNTDIAALLAARDGLAIIEKTSSANVRKNTQSKIQRHIIGRVPDRGGRAYEHQIPPPEMPPWQQRGQGGGGAPGGGGGRGGFGGPRGGGGAGRGGNQGFQNRNQSGGFDNRSQSGGYDNRSQSGGYDNRNQSGGYDNRNQSGGFQQQGGYQQQQAYQQQGNQQRVQGGWSQRGSFQDDHGGRGGTNNYQQQQQHGRSNYNRGGRR